MTLQPTFIVTEQRCGMAGCDCVQRVGLLIDDSCLVVLREDPAGATVDDDGNVLLGWKRVSGWLDEDTVFHIVRLWNSGDLRRAGLEMKPRLGPEEKP